MRPALDERENDLCFWIFMMLACSSAGWVDGFVASFVTTLIALYLLVKTPTRKIYGS